MAKHNIYLVGPMGAGKSTIGRLLSTELKLEFKDSDKEIEDRCGCNIPWIFDVEGEQGFRDREVIAIDEITQEKDVLMATGGGAVLRPENRLHLKGRGTVVYLKTSVDQQLARTAKDKNRPLLQIDNPREVLTRLMDQRDPLYQEVADITIYTDDRNPKFVVQEILKRLSEINIIE
ncbi:MAG: shikimate kinase [Bermanella sp.]|jgi:shikimate kinase